MADVAEGEDAAANARAKARAVEDRVGVPRGGAILAADTEVLLDGRALGKPADADATAEMLAALSGREHTVLSAVALRTEHGLTERGVAATVRFRVLSEAVRAWYVSGGEWRDRAGGYAIQGAGGGLVDSVAGEPSTVIGLPVGTVAALLESAGLAPWQPGVETG